MTGCENNAMPPLDADALCAPRANHASGAPRANHASGAPRADHASGAFSPYETTQGVAAFLEASSCQLQESDFRDVLIVDDDPAICRFLSQILRNAGYGVRQAADGLQAIAAVRESPPDFVVTDWVMPNVDGLEFCEMVRSESLPGYVYLIVLTGKTRVKDMVQAIAAGADDFFSKPVVPGELLARLQAGTRVLELEQRLNRLASCDPLTELLNRRTFFERFERLWEPTLDQHNPLSCMMIDIDLFKNVNDTYGHLTGDLVIRSVARVLESCCRNNELACRYGGEEFCVLLEGMGQQHALVWAENCRRTIAETPIESKRGVLHVTASLGVAERSSDLETPEALLDLADRALLTAKQKGRNRVETLSR